MKKQQTTYFCDRCKKESGKSKFSLYNMKLPHDCVSPGKKKELCHDCAAACDKWYKSGTPSKLKRLLKKKVKK